MQVVTVESGVDTKPAKLRLLGVRDPIVIGIAESFQFGIARDPHRVVPGENPGHDSGNLLIEALVENLRAIGMPGVLSVFQSTDAFLHGLQIVPVVDTVSVEVPQPGCVFLTPFRGHPAAEGTAKVSH